MPEWVQMVHVAVPESQDDPPLVTKEAFDEVWKKNGWKLYKPQLKDTKEK